MLKHRLISSDMLLLFPKCFMCCESDILKMIVNRYDFEWIFGRFLGDWEIWRCDFWVNFERLKWLKWDWNDNEEMKTHCDFPLCGGPLFCCSNVRCAARVLVWCRCCVLLLLLESYRWVWWKGMCCLNSTKRSECEYSERKFPLRCVFERNLLLWQWLKQRNSAIANY